MRGNTWSLRRCVALAGLLLLVACSKGAAPEQTNDARLQVRDELRLGVIRHSRERAREVAVSKGTRGPGRHSPVRSDGADAQ